MALLVVDLICIFLKNKPEYRFNFCIRNLLDGFQFKYLKWRSLPISFCCRLFTRATFSDAAHDEVVDAYK